MGRAAQEGEEAIRGQEAGSQGKDLVELLDGAKGHDVGRAGDIRLPSGMIAKADLWWSGDIWLADGICPVADMLVNANKASGHTSSIGFVVKMRPIVCMRLLLIYWIFARTRRAPRSRLCAQPCHRAARVRERRVSAQIRF